MAKGRSKASYKAGAKKAARTRARNAAKKAGGKKGARKASTKLRGKVVSRPKFAGHSYACRGKRVRSGKSRSKTPRVFCARSA